MIKNNFLEIKNPEVPPRLELGSLDSKSRVLTITPWDLAHIQKILSESGLMNERISLI